MRDPPVLAVAPEHEGRPRLQDHAVGQDECESAYEAEQAIYARAGFTVASEITFISIPS